MRNKDTLAWLQQEHEKAVTERAALDEIHVEPKSEEAAELTRRKTTASRRIKEVENRMNHYTMTFTGTKAIKDED